MPAADLPGTDEERAEAALIAAAAKILHNGNQQVPDDFISGLFAHAEPEDLMRCDPRQLAELAADAWSLLAVRKPGVPKIRLDGHGAPAGQERPHSESVLEIVNDDMPFLLDSVLAELGERGIDVRFVAHPIFSVERDQAGHLTAFKGIEQVLADVRLCVADWRAMIARVKDTIAELESHPPPLPAAEIDEAIAFLQWLVDNNFTFLGVRNYEFTDGGEKLEPVFESGLGILRSRSMGVLQRWNRPLVITPEMQALLKAPTLLIVTKAATRSHVHRRVHMDYVGVKRF